MSLCLNTFRANQSLLCMLIRKATNNNLIWFFGVTRLGATYITRDGQANHYTTDVVKYNQHYNPNDHELLPINNFSTFWQENKIITKYLTWFFWTLTRYGTNSLKVHLKILKFWLFFWKNVFSFSNLNRDVEHNCDNHLSKNNPT